MKNILPALILGACLLQNCGKPDDQNMTPSDTVASVWLNNACARILGFSGQKLVVYEDSHVRTYDKLTGQKLGEYHHPGLSLSFDIPFGQHDEFYLYQNKLVFLKNGDQTVFILNLDNMTVEQTLDASLPKDTTIYANTPFLLSSTLDGVGKYIFFNAGEDFHFIKYDLEESTQSGVYVNSLYDGYLDPAVKGAWLEPNGDLIMVGWKPNQSGTFPISAIYNETQQKLVAFTHEFYPIKFPILGHTGDVFFGNFDDLKAYSKTTAKHIWGKYNFADYKVGDEKIIVLHHNQTSIFALNASDGSTLWETQLPGTFYWHFIDLQNGVLTMYSNGDNLTLCFEADSGKEIFRLKGQQSGNSFVNDDYLYVSSIGNCTLACYKLK